MTLRTTIALLALLASTPLGCTDDPENGPEVDIFLSDRVLNIAHRGGSLLAPEETLVAFRNAVDLGVDALELDLRATSDGVILCLHDDTVDRTTDGTGEVATMTFEEVRRLDAAYHFTTDGGATFPHRGTGVTVPTFEEILDAVPNSHLVIEIKQEEPSIVEPVIELLVARGQMDRVILASSIDAVAAEIRETAPDVHTSFATLEMIDFITLTDAREADYSPPATFLQAPYAGIEETFVARAGRFGLKVHAWTVNDRADMERLISLGVDGIITDDPTTLGEVIGD